MAFGPSAYTCILKLLSVRSWFSAGSMCMVSADQPADVQPADVRILSIVHAVAS